MNIIETEKLIKKFGDTVAVDEVSLHVKEGEIYGFLGLNGAGKTTTIRLLLGMIRPDYGNFSLFGKKPKQAADIWNKIGYLVETPHSYPDLTVSENMEIMFRLRDLKDKSLIQNTIDKLHLLPFKNKKAKFLSTGNKQRLGLAKALLHRPELLILDEPINGLDPAGIVEIREYLKELVYQQNTTIFLSSHILSEIARLATRIGIVHEGRLIKEINISDLEQQIIKKLCIKTRNNIKAVEILKAKGYHASVNTDALIESFDEHAIRHPENIATLLVNASLPPTQLNVYVEDLESYFLRMIKNIPNETADTGPDSRNT